MLASILRKIAANDPNFTRREIPVLKNYFPYVVTHASSDTVKMILEATPAQQHINMLKSGFTQIIEDNVPDKLADFLKVAEEAVGEGSAAKLLKSNKFSAFRISTDKFHTGMIAELAQAGRTYLPKDKLAKMLCQDNFQAFLHSNSADSINTVNGLINIAESIGKDNKFAIRMLQSSYYGNMLQKLACYADPASIRNLINHAERLGGKSLVLDIMRANYCYAFTEAAKEKDTPPENLATLLELAKAAGGQEFIREILELGSFRIFDSACRNYSDSRKAELLLNTALELNDDTLITNLLKDDSYHLMRYATAYQFPELMQKIIETADRVGGKDLIWEMLKFDNAFPLRVAIRERKTASIAKIYELVGQYISPKTQKSWIEYDDIVGFRTQCVRGDVNAMEKTITLARQCGDEAFVKEILLAKDNTPLLLTCRDGKSEATQWLLNTAKELGGSGLVADMLKSSNFLPFRLAAENGHTEILQMLIKQMQSDAPDNMRKMLLVKEGKLLSDVVTHGGNESVIAIMNAAKAIDDSDIIRSILTAGEKQPLAAACEKGYFDTAKLLLEWAEQANDPSLIRDMLSANNYQAVSSTHPDDNLRPKTLQVLIEAAVKYGDPEIIKNTLTLNDNHAIRFACVKDNEPLIRYMLQTAHKTGGSELVKEMLTEQVGPPLMIASREGNNTIIKTLLKSAHAAGGDNLVGELLEMWDSKALALAVKNRHSSTLKLLIDSSADIFDVLQRDLLEKNDYAVLKGMAADPKGDCCMLREMIQLMPEEKRENICNIIGLSATETSAILSDMPKHELWQVFGGKNERWQSLLGKDAPDKTLAEYSPYKFSPKIYEQTLPMMQQLCAIEGPQNPELQAYKLAVLFPSMQEVERYLTHSATKWNMTGEERPIHDSLTFSLPKTGLWDVNRWKDFALQFGPTVTKYFERLPDVERYMQEKKIAFPQNTHEFRFLVSSVAYERASERPDFALMALEVGLSEALFNQGLDILRDEIKTKDHLPQIMIDGKDIGQPNYYLTKLEVSDPKGLILGKLTNCCQSIGSEGEECAVHGMTSENGGFYVWKQKTKGAITSNDKIVAQSWAWVGQKGELVFDSFERLGPAYNDLAKPFLNELAAQIVGKHTVPIAGKESKDEPKTIKISSVRLGTGGKTPNIGNIAKKSALPQDYEGYRDSKTQYLIKSSSWRDRTSTTKPEPAQERS